MPHIPEAQGNRTLEGSSVVIGNGRGHGTSGGVFDHGAQEEDGPVTREILTAPLMKYPVGRSAGDQTPRRTRQRLHARLRQEQAGATR